VIARFIQHGGFLDVNVVGGTGDGGADIVAVYKGKRYVIQAKYRSSGSINQHAVKEAFKAHWLYKADICITTTNRKFSSSAFSYRKERAEAGFVLNLWDNEFLMDQGDQLPFESKAKRPLRSYQIDAVSCIQDALNMGSKHALVTLATGLGKTVVAATFISNYLENRPDAKVLFLAHMSDLVRQLEQSCWPQLNKHIDTHIWTDGEHPSFHKGITFATWQSIKVVVDDDSLPNNFYDLIVVDECHHAASESFKNLLNSLDPDFLIGLTATPWRGDGESLRPIFGDPIFSMDIVSGMQQGYLADVDYQMLIDDIDWGLVRNLSTQGLTVKDLNKHLLVPERDLGMIETIHETISNTKNPRVLVFCRSIAHAERLRNFFRQFDVSAGLIHSGLSRSEKFLAISRFRTGDLKVLISIEMLNEGIDVPEVNIVVFARVTHSRRIFLQQLGRGLRLYPNKEKVIVLDFVADVRRLAAGVELNNDARNFRGMVETVRYQSGEIVRFSSDMSDFFHQYLTDMSNISDLDENATLNFPDL
jgi:superfamily II DNA or RNA helicase